MSVIASDNFTRGDNADLGTNWDECTAESGAGGFNISSNHALPSAGGSDSSETWNANNPPANQYVEVTLGTTGTEGVGTGIGPACRASATASDKTHYRLVGGGSGYELGRQVTSTFTSLSSGAGTTFTSGDKIKLEVSGTGASIVLRMYKNAVQFGGDIADSSGGIDAAGRGGIAHSSTTSVSYATNWELGDLAATPAIASVQPWHFITTQTGILVTGSGFETSQGTGNVIISPSDNVADAGIVNQTITAWADASVTFTAVRSALTVGTTLYLFVKNNTGNSNAAGIPVRFDVTGDIAWIRT